MPELKELVEKYYNDVRYNCSETILHAGNDYYQLGLHEEDMKMLAGFGSGMYSGSTCGALVASAAVISKIVVKTKAHDHLDVLRPVISTLYRNFRETLGGTDCAHVRPEYHTKETRCLNTCLAAAEVLERTVNEANLI